MLCLVLLMLLALLALVVLLVLMLLMPPMGRKSSLIRRQRCGAAASPGGG